ncbi:glycosyltransferase [Clostridium sp. HCS.1]|uniref:glycosyltransferase n=1 Tax=Clostridium sp. HCS.1 TaxID=3238594 RepID=UPI003A1032C3
MEKICFVILHYMSYKDTVECVESILNNVNYNNYNIIVVDNNSSNDSGKKLINRYTLNDLVEIIINNKNLGFAKGNNIGYKIAKEKYNAEFIVAINNDTIIEQKEFLNLIIEQYKESRFYLLGPDILSADGIHQNPQRLEGMKLEEVENLIQFYTKQYLKNKIIDIFKIHSLGVRIKKTMGKNNNIQTKENVIYENKVMDNVQLHGSCIIFSPLYIMNLDYAFYPETYMYGEEDILFYLCKINNYKIIFDPKIKIFHKEDVSTNYVLNNEIKKRLFVMKNGKESMVILKRIMLTNKLRSNNEENL